MKGTVKWEVLLATYLSLCIVPAFSLGPGGGETVLYRFQGAADGAVPYGVVFDRDGDMYGTTQLRGDGSCSYPDPGCGTVFEASPVKDGNGGFTGYWNKRVIYVFQGGNDGYSPLAPLVLDESGNLFGTTVYGGGTTGCGGAGCGTVFELSRVNGRWAESVLYRFTGDSDGGSPESSVTLDSAGNIFGTTYNGGLTDCGQGFPCGVVYELQHTESGWTEAVLHRFDYSDGANPVGGLVIDKTGRLYGVTSQGGKGNSRYENGGTIFELSPTASGWSFRVLYLFPSGEGGSYAGLTLDADGNLYGTANSGGIYGLGSVYQLQTPTQQGASWVFNTLFSFDSYDGSGPAAGVVFDKAGNLYGTTGGGGTAQSCDGFYPCGVVFELSQTSGQWAENVLYNFQGGTDGQYPNSTPVLDPWGNLYGTTAYGGDPNCVPFPNYSGCGTVFRISPPL